MHSTVAILNWYNARKATLETTVTDVSYAERLRALSNAEHDLVKRAEFLINVRDAPGYSFNKPNPLF